MSHEQIDYPREPESLQVSVIDRDPSGEELSITLPDSVGKTPSSEREPTLTEQQLEEDIASLNASFTVFGGVLEHLSLVMQQHKEAAIAMQNTEHTLRQCHFTSERYKYCVRRALLCEANSWRTTNMRLYPAAAERAQQYINKQRDKLAMRSVRAVKAVFLAGGIVQVPDWCHTVIPKRTEWQQDKALLPSTANDIYQKLVQEAVDWAVAQCEQIAFDEPQQPCYDDEVAVCKPESQHLDALQTEHTALVAQARQLEQSRDEEYTTVPADTLLSFCHYLTEHVPQISQTQIALLQWFDRSDKVITHDIAQRLVDRLWPKSAQHADCQLIDMQTEQIIAETAERLANALVAYQPTADQLAIHDSSNTISSNKRRSMEGSVGLLPNKSNQPDNVTSLPVSELLQPRAETERVSLDYLTLPHKLVPWLEVDSRDSTVSCKVVVDNVPGALVIDCRSKALQEIERRMDGYRSTPWDYIAPNVQQRLTHYAQVAMSDGGLIHAGKFSSVDKKGESTYPYPVIYSKDAKHNVVRVYISNLRVNQMDNRLASVREQLTAMQVHELIMLIGVCDKQHQLATLAEITGRSRRELRKQRVGSI